MTFSNTKYLAILLMAVGLASCKDDPVLVEKREKQKVELTRLKGELQVLEEKLKDMPPDFSTELAELKRQYAVQEDQNAKLEEEVTNLEQKKQALEEEYNSYRAKYPLK